MDTVTYVRLRQRILGSWAGDPLRSIRRSFRSRGSRQDAIDNAHLRAVLAAVLNPDSCCIDIGAHQGSVLQDLVRLAPQGRHYAFEPIPHLARALAARFPQVSVQELALSERAGEAEFVHVVSRPGFSGLRQRSLPRREEIQRLTVTTARLDDVLPADAEPAFIKMDVEGAEYLVLQGATATVARHRPVIAFEYGLGAADCYEAGPGDMFTLLAGELGMRIFDLDGNGPYTLTEFVRAFEGREHANFLARP